MERLISLIEESNGETQEVKWWEANWYVDGYEEASGDEDGDLPVDDNYVLSSNVVSYMHPDITHISTTVTIIWWVLQVYTSACVI